MVRSLAIRLWNTSPLWFIGAALVIQAVMLPFSLGFQATLAFLGSMAFVMVMAYAQNWSYALSSRSAMRNSNAYHLIAALVGSLTFFITFRYLFLRDMPLSLFLAYLFATVLGSVHGQVISMYIEKKLNLDIIATKFEKSFGIEEVKKEKGDPDDQFFRFWPSVVVLLVAFTIEIVALRGFDPLAFVTVAAAAYLIWCLLQVFQNVIQEERPDWTRHLRSIALPLGLFGVCGVALARSQFDAFLLVAVLLLGMPDSFLHAVLRVARSSDHYWFHLTASLMKMAFGFLQLMIIYKLDFNWSLFLPMATGGMLGSLTGSTFAAEFAKRIKAGFDEHVRDKEKKIGWPKVQLVTLLVLGSIAHLVAFQLYQWQGVLLLAFLAFAQTMSFTLISRARQRKSKQYHAWASVGSNGIWYLTMQQLVLGKIQPFQAAPYVVGNVTGSLIGQGTALQVERLADAVMVDRDTQIDPAKATA